MEVKFYWVEEKGANGIKLGCWIAKWKEDERWNKKRIPVNITSKAEAEIWFRDWNANRIANAVAPLNSQVKVVRTLRNLAPQWLEYKRGKVTPDFIRQAETVIKTWILPFPIADLNMEAEGAEPEPFMAWFGSVKQSTSGRTKDKLSAYYLRGIFVVTKLLIRDAMDNKWIKIGRNPLDFTQVKSERPKAVTKIGNDKVRLYKDEVATLLAGKIPDIRKVKYYLAFAAGMRDMELQGLTWADIKTVDGVRLVHVRIQLEKAGCLPVIKLEKSEKRPNVKNALVRDCKSNSSRKIPLHPEAIKALAWWKKTGWRTHVGRDPQPEDPIFPALNGDFDIPRSAEYFRMDLLTAGLSAKYDGEYPYDFHSTRRTFASLLGSVGVDQFGVVPHLMGHKASGTTGKHYIGDDLPALAVEVGKLPMPKWLDKSPAPILRLVAVND